MWGEGPGGFGALLGPRTRAPGLEPARPHGPCLQVSVPVHLPALGLGVLQLQLGVDGPRTLPSSVRVYLHGRPLAVSRHEAFPLRVLDSGAADFALSNRYMQVWFSGQSGLLKVKGPRGAGTSRCGRQAQLGVALGEVRPCPPGGRPDMPAWGQGSGLCFLAERPKGGRGAGAARGHGVPRLRHPHV